MHFFQQWLSGKAAKKTIITALILSFGVFAGIQESQAARVAKSSPAQAPPVRVVVSELPDHNAEAPPIAMSDVTVTQGRHRAEVVSWMPAQGQQAGLQLLILLDDSDRIMATTNQLTDLRHFILQQPSTTEVAVGYMYNGLVHMRQGFTLDHRSAVNAVHIPGSVGTASPYFSLMDMYHRNQWPVDPRYPRREVLMLTGGDDPYASPFVEDPYVDQTIGDMQRAGIEVFTIFTPNKDTADSGYRGGTLLDELSEPTGGIALYTGLTGTLISYTPYLNTLNFILQHQYLLTFQAQPEEKEDLQPMKIDVDNVTNKVLLMPERVLVPGAVRD